MSGAVAFVSTRSSARSYTIGSRTNPSQGPPQTLKLQLNSLKKEPSEDITQYVARAKELASHLDSIGHKVDESEVVLPILAGLPPEYSTLRTVIGAREEEPTVDKLLPMLLGEEQTISTQQQSAVPIYSVQHGRKQHHRGNKHSRPPNRAVQQQQHQAPYQS